MNKGTILAMVLMAGGLLSCQQESDSMEDVIEKSFTPEHSINLQDFSYQELQAVFNGDHTVDNIRFTDGDIVKDIRKLEADTLIRIMEEDGNITTRLYLGNVTDSVEVTLSEQLVSIRMTVEGQELGYVSYADNAVTAAAETALDEGIVKTRAAGQNILTRSASRASFKVDITAAAKSMEPVTCTEPPVSTQGEDEGEPAPAVATRGAFPWDDIFNGLKTGNWTYWPRNNIVTLFFIRDEADLPWEHELNWQINDVIASLKNVRWDLQFRIERASIGYRRQGNSSEALSNFREYCQRPDFRYHSSASHDIFFLVSHWGYGDVLGRAYLGAYQQKRYENTNAYGIACTTCFWPKTLAHEVGHTMGAWHVENHPWYLFWMKEDVMIVSNNWNLGTNHIDADNRDRVRDALWN